MVFYSESEGFTSQRWDNRIRDGNARYCRHGNTGQGVVPVHPPDRSGPLGEHRGQNDLGNAFCQGVDAPHLVDERHLQSYQL